MPPSADARACAGCRSRTALLASLAGRIDYHRHDRLRLAGLLALPDEQLVRALGLPGVASVHSEPARRQSAVASLASFTVSAMCRHDRGYPARLLELAAPPAMLHFAGDVDAALRLIDTPMVAVVGSRRPTEYGREVTRGIASALAATGVCVVSGMAMGIDAAAHEGALQAQGPTLAVLPGGIDVAYPPGKRPLHRRLFAQAAAWAELPPGLSPRRWCFPARNRIIAGLAQVTLIVEAQERSGALITAAFARDLGREVAAVPGPVTSSRSTGTNALIRDGAHLVRDAQDVLDLLYGVGARRAPRQSPALDGHLAAILEHVRRGRTTADDLARAGFALVDAQVGLTELELQGRLRRTLSGRYLPVVG